jgi:hypothetical protein
MKDKLPDNCVDQMDADIIERIKSSTLPPPDTQGALDEAITLANDYVEAHMFKKRITDWDRNARNNINEKIRLGGMQKILDALKFYRTALTRQPVVPDTQGALDEEVKSFNNSFSEWQSLKERGDYDNTERVADKILDAHETTIHKLIQSSLTRPSREAKLLEALKHYAKGEADPLDLGRFNGAIIEIVDNTRIAKQAIAEYEEK